MTISFDFLIPKYFRNYKDLIKFLITTLTLTLILTTIIVTSYFHYAWSYWKKRNVPHVKPTFPFGSFTIAGFFKKGFHFSMLEHYRNFKKQGAKYFGTYAITSPMLTIIDPELIKTILVKDHDYFLSHGLQYDKKDVFTLTLFNIEENDWKVLRSKLTATFSSGKLKSMFETLKNSTIPLKKFLNQQNHHEFEIDISELCGRFFTNVIGTCIFGFECDCFNQDDVFRRYGRQCFEERFDLKIRRVVAFTAPWLIKYLRFKVLKKEADNFFKTIFKDMFDYREKTMIKRNDFVQILLDLKQKALEEGEIALTYEEMLANSFLFFSAGFETSSSTTTYCLHELAHHQEVQDKIRDEIRLILKKYNGFFYECLSEFKYMDQVLYETLRKHPSAPTIPRKCTKDYQILNGPDIKKGMKVFINPLALHWDEDYFPDPQKFDPERFSDLNKDNIPPYTFLPFGIGPRKCIAERFGIAQIKVALVTILSNYSLKPHSKTDYKLDYNKNNILLISAKPIYVKMERIFY
ncbi:probable cytochrome P450 6a14 [Onthophagus taurus]|uniref:probable cytochrome P450 6a14 n=1 Tax=Onthophagus taurus TaxID=166361 RepID=UPI000C2038F3|nr:probable cytochrome P450 6a14 [Onthophagus taurus]XP_022900073.1 probable cytochrome P450 6a14 [Onthophagus taurus]